jgi:predicted peptidase
MYHFEDTNVDLPYSLYVSTKVTKSQKAPLVVSLHGLGATQTIMMTKAAVDLAEEGGYILVAPLGYNTGGWYGSPVMNMAGRGRGRGNGPAPGGDTAGAAPTAVPGGGTSNPPNLAELSEKDVLNVIALVRKEFSIDEKRMYLMGHSMGGAGTLFLGSKYASTWAAIAAEAPADFLMNNNRSEMLQKIKDANLPVMVVQGDIDEAVPVTNTRMWVDTMKELKLNFEYVEQPGFTHGPVIESGLKPIYGFFAQHTK